MYEKFLRLFFVSLLAFFVLPLALAQSVQTGTGGAVATVSELATGCRHRPYWKRAATP